MAAVACDGDDDETLDVGVTTGDVIDDPQEYYGVDVTISGEVNDVVTDRGFSIGGEGFFGGDEMLILTQDSVDTLAPFEPLEEDDIVQITGTVREFTDENIDSDEFEGYEATLDDPLADFEGGPVILAERVVVSQRVGAAVDDSILDVAIDIEDVLDHTEALVRQEVTVGGEVQIVAAGESFVLRERDALEAPAPDFRDGLLVIAQPDLIPDPFIDEALVSVRGTVYEFDEDASPELAVDHPSLFEDDLYDPFEGSAVVVASSIEVGPAAVPVSLTDLGISPQSFTGETITVGGVVEETIDAQAFVLSTDDDEDFVFDVLVLVPAGADAGEVVDDAFVAATGEFREFNPATLSEDSRLSDMDLERDDFDDFEDGFVIIAESLDIER